MSHRLIAYGKKSGKATFANALAETRAMEGEHVHLGQEKCFNGTVACDRFVNKRVHWNGEAFMPRDGK